MAINFYMVKTVILHLVIPNHSEIHEDIFPRCPLYTFA